MHVQLVESLSGKLELHEPLLLLNQLILPLSFCMLYYIHPFQPHPQLTVERKADTSVTYTTKLFDLREQDDNKSNIHNNNKPARLTAY